MLTIGEFARLGQISPRMLRHYDEVGLIRPELVDAATGYRWYGVSQLGALHRLLALRDLGFSLGQIGTILAEQPSNEELRGMLRLRQAQIEHALGDERARLRRVDAHLRALEGTNPMTATDIVIKRAQPVRLAESVRSAPGFGHDNLNPVFKEVAPLVYGHLARHGVRPGIMVAYYEEPADDGSVVVHIGVDIGDQEMPEGDGVRAVELPELEVASHVHRGTLEGIEDVYEALVRWVEDSGFALAAKSRELYHEWDEAEPARSVTELQLPIRRD
jgi:DNA-binding transcriptional MerR regulator/effector-binding domain-containing protein